MKTSKHDAIVLSSSDEKANLNLLAAKMKASPMPDDEILANLGVYLTSKNLSRLLFFYELYKQVVDMHGVIIEFGVRWGQNLSLLSALRGIMEPFNRHRKIIGFDTFEGFKGTGKEDGDKCQCADGSFSLPDDYMGYLDEILRIQEAMNPMSHLKRFELVKGDVRETLPDYLKRHPETIVSMAIFDFDIYAPTKFALEAIKPHLAKGSVLVFDELCDDIFPGETLALRETLGLNGVKIKRMPMTSRISYLEFE